MREEKEVKEDKAGEKELQMAEEKVLVYKRVGVLAALGTVYFESKGRMQQCVAHLMSRLEKYTRAPLTKLITPSKTCNTDTARIKPGNNSCFYL